VLLQVLGRHRRSTAPCPHKPPFPGSRGLPEAWEWLHGDLTLALLLPPDSLLHQASFHLLVSRLHLE